MSKLIPATLGHSIRVDACDYDRLSAFKWYAHNCGGSSNPEKRPARRTSVAEGRKVRFLVHHILRAPDGMVVDHINGDPWDNRRCNLRVCTHAENLRNRRKHRTGNPYKGVYWRAKASGYQAIITHDGDRFGLGLYRDAVEAARAYDQAALFLHGEFARLNFPESPVMARHPHEIMRERREIRIRPDARRTEAIAKLRGGAHASEVAKQLGVAVSTVCQWAANDGVKLQRGRPRTAA